MRQLRTAFWYLKRPAYWAQLLQVILKRFRPNLDTPAHHRAATQWAQERASSVGQALFSLGIVASADTAIPSLEPGLIAEGKERAAQSSYKMGGAGDVDLLYATAKITGAKNVVETGVAYGWSSLAILAAMDRSGRLVSVDMPYPGAGNEPFVGIVVPERLRANWRIVREPDRNGLSKALRMFDRNLDLVHYDSDKSYWGRMFGYRLMWDNLKPGGVFITDDIQDNMAFADFAKNKGISVGVTEALGKYVGIGVKPAAA